MSEDDVTVSVSAIWPNIGEIHVRRANAFLTQLGTNSSGPEEALLSIGYMAPPVLLGTPEEQRATVAALGAVEVDAIARVSMSRQRLEELIQVLQTVAQQWDGVSGQ